MEYLYYQLKMEPIKIKKRARTIPFGFKQSEDPEYLEPIKEELDALRSSKRIFKDLFVKRDCINGYIEKQEDTYHMSDLEKDSQEIAPPKPKRIVQQKAKKSVKQILARTRKKVAKAEQTLRSAKHVSRKYQKETVNY